MAEDPLSIAVEFGRRLEAATIPYAIGGALALGVHGVVRATSDVVLNVFVEAPRLDEVFAVLSSAGVTVAREQARDEALSRLTFHRHQVQLHVRINSHRLFQLPVRQDT